MSPTTDRPAAELDSQLNMTGGGRTQDPAARRAPVRRGSPSPVTDSRSRAGEGTKTPAVGASASLAPSAGSRTYTIALPAGLELLNANDRCHWTRRRRITAALREAAAWLARQQRIPRLGCVRITAVYEPPDRRRRDVPNLYPSFKACVDGLVDAGVLLDDSDRYVKGFEMSSGEQHPRGRLVLHLAEVTA